MKTKFEQGISIKVSKFVSTFTLILFLISSSKLYSQIEIDYGFFINPKLSTFIYEDNSVSDANKTLSFSLGGSIYLRKNNFEFSTGINYSRISINQIDYSPTFGCDLLNGFSDFDIYNSYYKDNYQIYYIGIPLNISYFFIESKNFYLDLGGEFLLKQSESRTSFIIECGNNEREISGNPTSETQNTLGKINMGIGYVIKNDKYSIFIQPIIEYSVSKIYKEARIVNDITNNADSLEFGIKMGFKI